MILHRIISGAMQFKKGENDVSGRSTNPVIRYHF